MADDPRLPLRFLFIEEKDDLLVKILSNCFNALKDVFYVEWETPTSNILWKSTGFRAVIYALSSLCRKGLREYVLTKDFFIRCFKAFKEELSKEQLTLTSKSFPGGGEQNQKRLASILIKSMANLNLSEYDENLTKEENIQSFIQTIDADRYELFDICQALDNGTVAYDMIVVETRNSGIRLIHRFSDTSIFIEEKQRKLYLKFIEKHYMNGLDYNSWIGFEEVFDNTK